MGRIVYVNGAYLDESEATVSIFDRGFLMSDAVYEVTSVLGGKLIDFPGHIARLHRSLSELGIGFPASDDELLEIHRELVARNDITDGGVYLQVTRGNPGDRDFAFPPADTPVTLTAALNGTVLATQTCTTDMPLRLRLAVPAALLADTAPAVLSVVADSVATPADLALGATREIAGFGLTDLFVTPEED